MWANNVVYWLVRVLYIPVNILSLGTTLVGGIIMIIPLLGLLFVLLISLVWIVLLAMLVGTAWFWHRAPAGVRSLAALCGVPVALIANTFITLTPGGGDPQDQFAKKVKQGLCQDWPYAYAVAGGKPAIQAIQDDEGVNFFMAVSKWADARTAAQAGRPFGERSWPAAAYTSQNGGEDDEDYSEEADEDYGEEDDDFDS